MTSKLNNKQITAFIPGTIVEVRTKVGDTVKAGDILAILDAMKMNNRLTAPVNGVVKEVNVKPGDRVCKGFVIISIE
ncbi:MAG: biotin/lipoyl-binding protein [Bacteroidales bacterium]|nr:biotin/lipoyl-binding protein [Bacteroidales bacterium]HPD94655.1 biotin/lipoyl-binding protein [Tenuifilaceae bacterium]HRX31060.1 biotin/lipoyl-binding protein [Tenuifilaceae bacterium]